MKTQKYIRKFVGFFPGQSALIEAEVRRRGVSVGIIVREIFDGGVRMYRKAHVLPPTYPTNQIK